MEMLYCGLEQIEGVRSYGNHDVCRGPVMSLNFQGLKASDAAYILESGYGIIVRSGLHCSPLIHKAMGTEERNCESKCFVVYGGEGYKGIFRSCEGNSSICGTEYLAGKLQSKFIRMYYEERSQESVI